MFFSGHNCFCIIKLAWGAIGWTSGGEVNPERVEAFDSATVTLFKDILKGAGRNPSEGDKKGGVKIFAKMNLAEGVPNYICIRSAATNETVFLMVMELPEYGIAVFDKGYNR